MHDNLQLTLSEPSVLIYIYFHKICYQIYIALTGTIQIVASIIDQWQLQKQQTNKEKLNRKNTKIYIRINAAICLTPLSHMESFVRFRFCSPTINNFLSSGVTLISYTLPSSWKNERKINFELKMTKIGESYQRPAEIINERLYL